jgi:c-di-GMP-binding flagellar brake protein YcgR
MIILASVQKLRPPQAHAGAVLALLALAVLACIGAFVVVKWRERRRRERTLRARMKDLKLTPVEQDTLRQLVKLAARSRGADIEPTAIFDEISLFEEAVDMLLRSVANPPAHFGRAPLPEAEAIASLRMKLGHTGPRRGVYYSTRELHTGQEVFLTVGSGNEAVSVRAKVGSRREDGLRLVQLQPRSAIAPGRMVEIGFFSNGHNFSFTTEVAAFDRVSASCLALHSLAVRTGGRRRFYRVQVGRPVRVIRRSDTGSAAANDQLLEGRLHDLSTRGAGIVCPIQLDGIERLTLDMSPYVELPQTTRAVTHKISLSRRTENRLPPPDVRITAEVVGVHPAGAGSEGYFYHLEFRDVKPVEEQHLSQIVNTLERATWQ